jgi:hypothetical protein
MCWLSSCTTRTCPLLLCVPTPGRLQPHHSHKHSCYTWCAPAQVARNCQPQSKNWWDRCAWVLARAAMNSQGGCNQARPSPVQLLTLMRRVAQLSCFCVQGCQQCVLGSTTSSLDRSAALAQQCSYSSHATAQYNGMLLELALPWAGEGDGVGEWLGLAVEGLVISTRVDTGAGLAVPPAGEGMGWGSRWSWGFRYRQGHCAIGQKQ